MRAKPWLIVPPLLLSLGPAAWGQSQFSTMPPAFVGGTTALDGHTTVELTPNAPTAALAAPGAGSAADTRGEVMHGLPQSDLKDAIPSRPAGR
jgi:hypothetical protein